MKLVCIDGPCIGKIVSTEKTIRGFDIAVREVGPLKFFENERVRELMAPKDYIYRIDSKNKRFWLYYVGKA